MCDIVVVKCFVDAAGLSVEAVTAHTAGTAGEGGAKAPPSTVSNKHKASTVSEPKSKADKSVVGGKLAAQTSSGEAGSQVRDTVIVADKLSGGFVRHAMVATLRTQYCMTNYISMLHTVLLMS